MRVIKLKSQPKWIIRSFMLLGVVLGGLFAFVFHPIGGTNADNNMDIVIQVTVTEPGQTLKINKYFSNSYTVDWESNGNPVLLSSAVTHTFDTVGTKNITLSLTGGANRWRFQSWYVYPLVPQAGTTVTGVQIIGMPSLAEGFGESASAPGNQFFFFFNDNGAITGLPEGSFDTSNITVAGNYFFSDFNSWGFITGLPEGSFNMANIVEAGYHFYYYFNFYGHLTYLPDSFTMSSVGAETQGGYYIAFKSPDYTLNKNVSDLVAGIALPLGKSHAFSDNQQGRCGVDAKWLDNIEGACGKEDCENGYYAVNNKCLPVGTDYGLFYEDDYIKITDGDDVVYIKDRNQGAEISMKTIFEKYESDENNWDWNIYEETWNDENIALTYGDYYFWGNNSGVSYNDFEFGEQNNDWKITNLEELESMGFNGGKIGDDNTGWEEGENGNPCNADEGEYLPTVEDWANAYLLLGKIDSNIDSYFGQGEIGLSSIMTRFLISPAPYVRYPYNSEGYFEFIGVPSFYMALDGSGNVGLAGWDGEGGYYIYYGSSASHQGWNDTAAPVRCFIDPEYIEGGVHYTVTFKDGDDVLFTKSIKEGKTIKNVKNPTKEGYGFLGWYRDVQLTNEFDVTTLITGDITLYAKWGEKGVFYENGYIKVTNGSNTIYIKDGNQGADSKSIDYVKMMYYSNSLSLECGYDEGCINEGMISYLNDLWGKNYNLEQMMEYYSDYFGTSDPDWSRNLQVASYGDYYYRGNNSGVKYTDFEFNDGNDSQKITNMEILAQEKGFNGGKIGDDNTGWEEGENGNPCDVSKGEYLPVGEDWKTLMELWGDINGLDLYNESNYNSYNDEEYMYYSYGLTDSDFHSDILIPGAGSIENGRYQNQSSLWISLDNQGNIGGYGLFNDDSIEYSNYNLRLGNDYYPDNSTALPVRCFIDPEYVDVLNARSKYVIPTDDDFEISVGEETYTELLNTITVTTGNISELNDEPVYGELTIDFGSGEGARFSKLVQVNIPVEDASRVVVKVKHAGSDEYNFDGLTKNRNASCNDNGRVVDDADKYIGETIRVVDGFASIYTCEASSFIAIGEGPVSAQIIIAIEKGELTIGNETGILDLGHVGVSNDIQEIIGEFGENSFWVEDMKGVESGYYTTISVTDLSGSVEGHTIPANSVYLKTENGIPSLITGASVSESLVVFGDNIKSWHSNWTAPVTYFHRENTPSNLAGRVGKWGDNLQVKINVPAHTPSDTYRGTIIYTLYDMDTEN